MTFNKEQIETLSAYEEYLGTAVRAKWARNPGSAGLKVIYTVYTQATGDTRRFNDNCGDCILRLLQDCGKAYFKDKEELARREVAVSDQEAETVPKAPVKTAKKKAKK